MQPSGSTPHDSILGVQVSAIDLAQTLTILCDWIESRSRQYVVVCPVYNVMMAQQDAQYRTVMDEAGLITPDGMPLVWLCRLMGHRSVGRVYGPDLLLAMSKIGVE